MEGGVGTRRYSSAERESGLVDVHTYIHTLTYIDTHTHTHTLMHRRTCTHTQTMNYDSCNHQIVI